MMLTQNGKLLYISDNAAEYLGHSMVSLLRKLRIVLGWFSVSGAKIVTIVDTNL